MANKTQIEDKITTVLTGNLGKTTRADHESFLKVDANSLLEAIYGDEITETHEAQSIFSIAIPNIEYNLKIQKIGRSVTLDGVIINKSNATAYVLLNVDNDDYKCVENSDYTCQGYSTDGSPLTVRIFSVINVFTSHKINAFGGLMPDERVRFSLTYNTEL